jgi:RNA polymerase sigma factor (sigma-70 family)
MADRRATGILRQLGDAARWSLPDAALLAWFVAERDEPAFAELVRRHGPMVLGVCQRITRQRQDAEDAFQATFLILARKAGRIARPELLANWLYGVAYRVARKARRRAREGQVAVMPDTGVLPAESTSDLAAFLDAELAALPERFRAAIVLCDLYELSHPAAAERLGIPKGTLSNRLSAGRKKLAARLARRGITLPAVGLGVALGGVTPTLAARTVTLALGGVVSATVQQLTLTGGASMKAIGWTAAACAAIGLAAGAVSALPDDEPAKPAPAAKAEEPKAKPDPRGDEPAARGKAKLMKLLDMPVSPGLPVWSSDGTVLVVREQTGLLVLDGRTLVRLATLSTGAAGRLVGFTPDNREIVTYFSGPRQINRLVQLRYWDLASLRGRGGSRMRAVNLDPADGTPVAITPDGKTVLTLKRDTKPSPGAFEVLATRFRLIDSATGERIKEVIKVAGSITGYVLSAGGDRLTVGWYSAAGSAAGRLIVQCVSLEDGKEVWKYAPDSIAPGYATGEVWNFVVAPGGNLRASPDGKLLAVTLLDKGDQAKGAQKLTDMRLRIKLLNAATGIETVRLDQPAGRSWVGLSFSRDGRSFAGKAPRELNDARLRIWDARTGRALKTWAGEAVAAFAPDRPVLAISEEYAERVPNTDNAQPEFRSKAILGLWDVSPLLKAAPAK